MHEDIKLKLGLVTYISHTSISPQNAFLLQREKEESYVKELC